MMTQLEWRSGQHGSIIGANVHDASMLGLSYAIGSHAKFSFRRLAGDVVHFVLSDLRELTVTELWDGAILSDVSAWRAGSVPDHLWQVADGGWNALLRTRSSEAGARLTAAKITARQPEPLLLLFEYTYGGQIAAICNSLQISQEAA